MGIFVSSSVAKLEHRAILESLDDIERLAPGLYEMKILNPTGDPDCRKPQYSVRFEPRRVEDVRYEYPREEFERARAVSEWNEQIYKTFMSPWVRATANPLTALLQKWLHPMRVSRYMFSERLNPWMSGVAAAAQGMPRDARGTAEDNPWMALEQLASRRISAGLDANRKNRDRGYEQLFAALYGARSFPISKEKDDEKPRNLVPAPRAALHGPPATAARILPDKPRGSANRTRKRGLAHVSTSPRDGRNHEGHGRGDGPHAGRHGER